MTRIKYTPRWPGSIQGHAINTVRSFYPALSAEYEFDDLMQEAYIVFMKVKKAFRDTEDNPCNPKWFMSLFSRSLHNKLINIKALSGRYSSIELMHDDDEPRSNADENFLRLILQELPTEVQQLIDVFCFSNDVKASRAAYTKLRQMYPDAV
jgi:hypothetical protein